MDHKEKQREDLNFKHMNLTNLCPKTTSDFWVGMTLSYETELKHTHTHYREVGQ